MLFPCVSYDLKPRKISFTLAAENGDVHHSEPVNSALHLRTVYLSTRRVMPALPEWDVIGDRLIRQYCLLLKDIKNKEKGAIAA